MHTCSIYIFRQARQREKERERETEGKTQKSSFPLADVPGSQQFQLVKKKREFLSFLFCIYFRLDYFHLGTRIFTALSQNEDVEG
jgi:hypothetical protein